MLIQPHTLICVHNDEKNRIECDILKEKDPKTKEMIPATKEKYIIPDGSNNRLMLETDNIITCTQIGGEVDCTALQRRRPSIPRICTKEKLNGKKIDNCGITQGYLNMIKTLKILEEAEKLKKGFNDFLTKYDIKVVNDPFIEAGVSGYADCQVHGVIAYRPDRKTEDIVATILHEFAHCKESIERKRKGLPPIEAGVTGGWEQEIIKKLPSTEKGEIRYMVKLIPRGHELRAEKFKKRIMRLKK